MMAWALPCHLSAYLDPESLGRSKSLEFKPRCTVVPYLNVLLSLLNYLGTSLLKNSSYHISLVKMSLVVGSFLEVPFILFFSICLDIMSQRMHAKCDTFFLKKMCQQW